MIDEEVQELAKKYNLNDQQTAAVRRLVANYTLAALMDSKIAREAVKICNEGEPKMNHLANMFDELFKKNPQIEKSAQKVIDGLKTFGERMKAKTNENVVPPKSTGFLNQAPACASLGKTHKPTEEHLRACIMELIRAVDHQSKTEVKETRNEPNKNLETLKDKVRKLIEDAVIDGYQPQTIEDAILSYVGGDVIDRKAKELLDMGYNPQ